MRSIPAEKTTAHMARPHTASTSPACTTPARALPVRAVLATLALALALWAPVLRPAAALAQNATPAPARTAEAPAENPAQQAAQPSTQQAAPHPAIPVIVEHAGEDKLGEMLAFQLKEAFARTVSFRPAKDKEKALKVRLVSAVEIADRPDFGSAYSVTWLYSEGPTVLSYYLDGAVGFVQPAKVREEAESLTARTDKAVSKFGYLFKQEK